MNSTQIIILAGGAGTRMQSETPKVLALLHGKPLIMHLLESIKISGVCESPVIVVGKKREMVMEALGPDYAYAIQEQQLGTGHAVQVTESILKGKAENIMVLYGDMPYISVETIKKLSENHVIENNDITMATAVLPDFDDWHSAFYNFGRILRNAEGNVIGNVEFKDATDEQKEIKEVNPCYFVFKADWLWSHLDKLENKNNQSEYYLTDVVKMAVNEKAKFGSVKIDPKEALGVNTRENLEFLHKI